MQTESSLSSIVREIAICLSAVDDMDSGREHRVMVLVPFLGLVSVTKHYESIENPVLVYYYKRIGCTLVRVYRGIKPSLLCIVCTQESWSLVTEVI